MTIYSIEVEQPGSKTKFYSAEYQTTHAAQLQADLERTWSYGLQAYCLCQSGKKLLLYPRKSPRGYILCRYPDTGRQHAEKCGFYGVSRTQSGAADYSPGVIRLEDGVLKIRPLHGLTKRRPADPAVEMPVERDKITNRRKYGRASELGVLHTIWEEFQVNQWWPAMQGKRTWFTIGRHLLEKSQQVKYGQSELSAALAILVPNVFGDRARLFAEQAQSVFTAAHKNNRRFLILCEMTRFNQVDGRPRCDIKGAWSNYQLDAYIPPELVESWQRRYPLAISGIDTDHSHCIGLLIGEVQNPDKKGRVGAKILHGALMPVTRQFIPYDSSHEARLANILVERSRAFSKPLRYDSDDDTTLPDFLLLDVRRGDEYPCEVFGMNTADYLARRQAKEAFYNSTRGADGWWNWDAAADADSIPPLPSKGR